MTVFVLANSDVEMEISLWEIMLSSYISYKVAAQIRSVYILRVNNLRLICHLNQSVLHIIISAEWRTNDKPSKIGLLSTNKYFDDLGILSFNNWFTVILISWNKSKVILTRWFMLFLSVGIAKQEGLFMRGSWTGTWPVSQ